MSVLAIFICIAFLVLSQQKKNIHQPDDFILIRRIERNTQSSSQGLHFANSTHLIESAGYYGNSEIHYLQNGTIILSHQLEDQYQGQGIDVIQGQIYHLTWREKKIFIRDFSNLEIVKIMDVNIDSMVGLSHNENKIFITDGTDTLYVLDETFDVKQQLKIKSENSTIDKQFGDIVYVDGYLYAVSLTRRLIFVIDVAQQLINKYYDLELMLEEQQGTLKGITFRNDQQCRCLLEFLDKWGGLAIHNGAGIELTIFIKQAIRNGIIIPMQTSNNDSVFTSTTDIHTLYTFGKVLGIGSFGKVILAQMKSNPSKSYAIKMIDKKNIHEKEALLANEIYTLQRLDHPNIIKFFQVYQSEVYIYICMEYCEGGELVERIAKQQVNLTEQQVQKIISKICSAVAYIHEQGIVHRDIKAENILFSEQSLSSEPKLIDFGFSNKFDAIHRRKRLKTFIGTPLYMPPEVIEGEYDEKCDVWSLGVLLYSLLCGQPPFVGQTKEKLFLNIRVKELRFDQKIWLLISDEVKHLLSLMLCKDPAQRPSAKQVLEHPWFQVKQMTKKQNTLKCSEDKTLYEMLRTYRSGAKFKKEVTKVLINQMNEQELQRLKQIFQQIDVDNSGTITIQELKAALMKEGSVVTHWEIEQLMQTIVLEDDEGIQLIGEQDGTQFKEKKSPRPMMIKYTDFLAACIDQRRLFTRERLWSLFKYFDTMNVGYIEKDDIKEALARNGRMISDEKIDEMIYEIDPNHDNKITFDEFCQMMCDADQTIEIIDNKEPPSRVD